MKSGLDFFPLDVHLDEKFELIEAEFGLTGFSVVVKLFQRIYGGEGYYCEWKEEVALLFARQVGLGGSVVSEILSAAIARGIFDKSLFEKYGILTSSGIQKRYFEAVVRRKQVDVKSEFLLLRTADLPKNVCISGENVNINSKNADISKQSKVKESKGKESRVKESITRAEKPARAHTGPTLEEVKEFYKTEHLLGDPEKFFDLYESRGWYDSNGNKIFNWQFLAKYWSKNEKFRMPKSESVNSTIDWDAFEDQMKNYVPAKVKEG